MSELSKTQLRRLDLTVLLVFLGLVRHRKAAAVAAELGLTQSAISQALKRLRDIFEDDLFLRRPHGMEPTATALALEAPLRQAVETLRGALGAAKAFDAAQAEGIVRIAALDAEQAGLIPPFAAALRETAPGLSLSVLPLGRADAVEALTDGRVDLALGFVWNLPGSILAQALYHESFLVVGQPSRLPEAPVISLDAYCAADHVLVSPAGDLRGVADQRLEEMGRRRNIVLGLPAFLPALSAVADFDALLTLPARLARRFAPAFGLVTADPPLDMRSFPVSVFRHRRNAHDAKTDWMVQQLVSSMTQ